MSLKRIRLELARTPDFPEGSPAHGHEFVGRLEDQGDLDLRNGRRPRCCTARRFWKPARRAWALIIVATAAGPSPTRRRR